MTTMQIGKPNYNNTSTEKLTYYKLGMKDNQRTLVVRLAPPIKSLAETGKYAVYVKQHFGYQLEVKEGKSFPVPFLCVERRDRNKNVVQECPECNEIALRKASVEAKRERLKADGIPEAQAEAQLRPLVEWLKSHNCDKKWTMLAKDESGKWGYLSLSHTAFTDLQREIKDLIATGVITDPLGVEEGVWFRFTRTGEKFNEIKDTCKAVLVKNGSTLSYKTDSLTQTDLDALNALPDLTTVGRRIAYEQIQALVESGGDKDVVKSVFNSAQKSESSPVKVDSRPTTPVSVAGAYTPPVANVSELPPATASASALQAQLAALQAQLASLQAPSTTSKPEPVKATQPTPTSTMTKQLDMDPDEFLAQFGAD